MLLVLLFARHLQRPDLALLSFTAALADVSPSIIVCAASLQLLDALASLLPPWLSIVGPGLHV